MLLIPLCFLNKRKSVPQRANFLRMNSSSAEESGEDQVMRARVRERRSEGEEQGRGDGLIMLKCFFLKGDQEVGQ